MLVYIETAVSWSYSKDKLLYTQVNVIKDNF